MRAWTRSEMKESALDYPERYETPERTTLEDDLRAPATDGQRALLEMLGGPELAQKATWVEARDETARLLAERAYSRVEGWLRETGMSEHAAHELVAGAANRIDAGSPIGGPYDHVEGRTVDIALTLAADRRHHDDYRYAFHLLRLARPRQRDNGLLVSSKRRLADGTG